jgi:hypothetical protein
VTALITKPTVAIPIMTVMCQVRSLNLPDEMPTQMPTTPATSEGGAVSTRVIVVLKPSDETTVGKNFYRVSGAINHGLGRAYLVERSGAQMHILHEHQKVKSGVTQCLHEACLGSLTRLQANSILLDAVMCELPLLWREPPCRKRLVR